VLDEPYLCGYGRTIFLRERCAYCHAESHEPCRGNIQRELDLARERERERKGSDRSFAEWLRPLD
jgi:hypothetical protein